MPDRQRLTFVGIGAGALVVIVALVLAGVITPDNLSHVVIVVTAAVAVGYFTVSWVNSINPVFIIVLAPVFAMLWTSSARASPAIRRLMSGVHEQGLTPCLPMSAWVRPIRRGWVVRDEVPGPDVDEFAEPDRVITALAAPGAARRSLLAVQHPHRTPDALAAGLRLADALPLARSTLAGLQRTAYRPIADVVAPYIVDGPDGSATGLLCMVNPVEGLKKRVRHMEQVYPDVVAERAAVLTGLGCLTSAALLIPAHDADNLTEVVRRVIGTLGNPAVSTVDSSGRRHRLWLAEPSKALLKAAMASQLLVADGNHRVAAAAAAGLDGLLALITSGPDLRIGAFHRVLTGTGLTAEALTVAWRRAGLTVHPGPADAVPSPGRVVVRCPERTLQVELPPATELRVDHDMVEDLLLDKALGIDPAGTHVRPLPGGRPYPDTADAVLLLAPVPLSQVRAVHADGRRMPRKSTYFTPKPRSGLVLADLLLSTND